MSKMSWTFHDMKLNNSLSMPTFLVFLFPSPRLFDCSTLVWLSLDEWMCQFIFLFFIFFRCSSVKFPSAFLIFSSISLSRSDFSWDHPPLPHFPNSFWSHFLFFQSILKQHDWMCWRIEIGTTFISFSFGISNEENQGIYVFFPAL